LCPLVVTLGHLQRLRDQTITVSGILGQIVKRAGQLGLGLAQQLRGDAGGRNKNK